MNFTGTQLQIAIDCLWQCEKHNITDWSPGSLTETRKKFRELATATTTQIVMQSVPEEECSGKVTNYLGFNPARGTDAMNKAAIKAAIDKLKAGAR